MQRVVEELGLSDDTLQTGRMLALRASKSRKISGRRGSDNISAAALVLAAKQAKEGYTAKDITACWREVDAPEGLGDEFAMKGVLRAQKAIAKEFGMENLPPQPEVLVERHGADLEIPDPVVGVAKRIVDDVREKQQSVVTGGRSPDSIAASALYLAVYLNGLRLKFTQETIAEAVDVTAVTVRNTYQDLADALGGTDALSASVEYSVDGVSDGGYEAASDDDTVDVDEDGDAMSETMFVFSGRLVGSGLSRGDAHELVEQHGGETAGSVSKFTDYLVVGADPGVTKLDSAKKWNTSVLDEHEFFQLANEVADVDVPPKSDVAVPPMNDDTTEADDGEEAATETEDNDATVEGELDGEESPVAADGGAGGADGRGSESGVTLSRSVATTVESLIDVGRLDAASFEAFVGDSVQAAVTRRLGSNETPAPVSTEREATETVTVPLDSMLREMVNALVTNDDTFDNASVFVEAVVRERVADVAEPVDVSVTFPVDVLLKLAERVEANDEYSGESDAVRDIVVETLRGE